MDHACPAPLAPASVPDHPSDPPADTAAALTLADVIARLQADRSLPIGRQCEMISAVRTTARLLGCDPAALPAAPRYLRECFQTLSAAAAGFSLGRWNTGRRLRSDLRAVEQSGPYRSGLASLPRCRAR